MAEILANTTIVIILQYMSNQHAVHLKITMLYVNYIQIKIKLLSAFSFKLNVYFKINDFQEKKSGILLYIHKIFKV